jgi:hypothetical protein
MRALSRIKLLSRRQLDDIQVKLNDVESCVSLSAVDMKTHASCPYCGFNPVAIGIDKEKASTRLEKAAQEFNMLCQSWLDVLLTNLATKEAAQNMALIDKSERESVQTFLQTHKLPDPLTERFLNGVENTLEGLEVQAMDGAEFLLALTSPGMPCTPEDLEKRIREYLQEKLEGKDRSKLRLQINW